MKFPSYNAVRRNFSPSRARGVSPIAAHDGERRCLHTAQYAASRYCARIHLTGLKEVKFDGLPETCPCSAEEILNDEFW